MKDGSTFNQSSINPAIESLFEASQGTWVARVRLDDLEDAVNALRLLFLKAEPTRRSPK